MEHAYAQALYDAIEAGMASHEAVARLKKSLKEHGREKLLPRVARAFRRIAQLAAKANTMQLRVAREKDLPTALQAVEAFLAEVGIGKTDLVGSVDDSLIGGWRLEGRGVLVDASWKKDLLSLYTGATK